MSSVGKTATISFAEYPELFNKKYMNVPEAYMVRLQPDYSFFTDLDSDGTLEEVNCNGLFNETDRFYTQFGIYTDVNGYYQYEELFAYDYQPYYVKTEDGDHYIYLFCEENEIGNHVQGQMMLVVYNVNDGVITRAGAVLNFEDCNNIFLHGLTMGHTQDGACDSSVISFLNTTYVYLTAMDLYGCGMYGFDAMQGSGNIYLQSCTIRDCEDGPLYITEAKGKYEFRNCWLSGSNGGGYYEPADEAELSFIECNFGEKETNYWYYDEYATFTDCYWEEITEYPDVEPESEYYLDIDSLNLMPLDGDVEGLADTYYAYMIVDQQSGDTVYYPHFQLQLSEDGTGYCESEYDNFDFIWYYEADGMLTLEGDSCYYYLTPYIEKADGYEKVWFMMQMNEKVIWLY